MAVPLFETVGDLEAAPAIMRDWLATPAVAAIAKARGVLPLLLLVAKDLTGMHREVDPTHRMDDTVLGGEPYVEILDLQHGHSRGRCRQGTGLEGLVFFLAHA